MSFVSYPSSVLEASESGFVVLPELFVGSDLAELRDASDQVLARVLSMARGADTERTTTIRADGHRLLDIDGTTIHWEPDAPDVVRGIMPVTHLDPRLDALWTDPRLTRPMCELLGADRVEPYFSGLNFKKAGVGSEYRWHQDAAAFAESFALANAMIFFDQAKSDNGPLCLLPRSHLVGRVPADPSDPIELADPSMIDERDAVPILVEAGSVVIFPALMLHRSGPNRSRHDRRALLLRFRGCGRPVRPEAGERRV